jgi:hypothetical protein
VQQPIFGHALVCKIERISFRDKYFGLLIGKPAHNCRAHHSLMACNVNALSPQIKQDRSGQGLFQYAEKFLAAHWCTLCRPITVLVSNAQAVT